MTKEKSALEQLKEQSLIPYGDTRKMAEYASKQTQAILELAERLEKIGEKKTNDTRTIELDDETYNVLEQIKNHSSCMEAWAQGIFSKGIDIGPTTFVRANNKADKE